MADNKKDNPGPSDETMAWSVGTIFTLVVLYKLWKLFIKWIHQPTNQLIFVGIIISLLTVFFYWIARKREKFVLAKKQKSSVIEFDKDSVYCGQTTKDEEVFIKTKQRVMHAQVIGTTNAGKTESVILPWAIQDIEQGRGLLLIDGKSDRSLLNKLWAYTVKHGREKDFRLFSLAGVDDSHQFNPLIGGTPEEITERVFNSFGFEEGYYKDIQFEIFAQVMRVFSEACETPTFLKLHQAITDPNRLVTLTNRVDDESLKDWVSQFKNTPATDRLQRTSGLTAALSSFAFGKTSALFNTERPTFTIEEALKDNLIVYCQLPVLLAPFLGKACGKMILQCLQGATANRHLSTDKNQKFFSVFLDDFSEYLYPNFISILNKTRSANLGVVFSHQALGDIQTLGDAVANTILTNTNIKVFMRGNDPDTAEYCAKVVGTTKGEKFTSRTKKGFGSDQSTGDGTIREVEEFIVHPNKFKKDLGVGEAVMVIPHDSGSRTVELKFRKYDDLKTYKKLERVQKYIAQGLPIAAAKTPDQKIIQKEVS